MVVSQTAPTNSLSVALADWDYDEASGGLLTRYRLASGGLTHEVALRIPQVSKPIVPPEAFGQLVVGTDNLPPALAEAVRQPILDHYLSLLREQIEQVGCPSCASAEAHPLFHIPMLSRFDSPISRQVWEAVFKPRPFVNATLGYAQCQGCAVVYQNWRVREAHMDRAWLDPRWWWPDSLDEQRRLIYPSYTGVMRYLARHLPGPGPILDFGCGYGLLLAFAQETDPLPSCTFVGADESDGMARLGREQLGVEVTVAPVEHLPWPDGCMAGAVSTGVFEHLYHPVEALRELRRVLQPGGIVVSATPNHRSAAVIALGQLAECFIPNHVAVYDPDSLAHICRRTGFEVVECDTSERWFRPGHGDMVAVLRRLD